jgi:hypothetical protein
VQQASLFTSPQKPHGPSSTGNAALNGADQSVQGVVCDNIEFGGGGGRTPTAKEAIGAEGKTQLLAWTIVDGSSEMQRRYARMGRLNRCTVVVLPVIADKPHVYSRQCRILVALCTDRQMRPPPSRAFLVLVLLFIIFIIYLYHYLFIFIIYYIYYYVLFVCIISCATYS